MQRPAKIAIEGKIVIRSATGEGFGNAPDLEKLQNAIVTRQLENIRNFRDPLSENYSGHHIRVSALAFDYRYSSPNNPDEENSTFYVPNESAFILGKLA